MKNLLITGDSLSYNRYGYDETPRIDAMDCHIGMNSWSFRIRKAFIASAKGFKFGSEINFKEKCVSGLGEGTVIDDAIFGEKVATIFPENGEVNFEAESDTGKIVLYFQCRRSNYCRFNVYVDGVLSAECVDTYSKSKVHFGFGLETVELECDKTKKVHRIKICDFAHTELEPYVTLAGVSCEPRYAYVTGQGGRTAKFILYHFEDRVLKYSPDMVILTLGANDIVYCSEKEYETNMREIFSKIKENFPDCVIYTLTIPPSEKVLDEMRGIQIKTQKDLDDIICKYNGVLLSVSKEFGAECIDTQKIFEGISPKEWRFDNIHFSNKGNDLVFDKVCSIIKENCFGF